MFLLTTATKKISKLKKRIRAIQGGSSASKTVSILLLLINAAQQDKVPTLTSIVSESLPHLRRGAIRDFMAIMNQHGYYRDAQWNKSDSIYTFRNGSQIEFFGVEQSDKVKGPRRDRLFINEADHIDYETFNQLEIRTKELIFLDWNPAIEFWYYDKVAQRNDVDFLILTYKDNEALDQAIRDSLEQRMGNKSWWKVYGEGQLGEIETQIYKNWKIIDEVPHEAKLERTGLDFGYTNDPTSIIDVWKWNQALVLDEIAHQKGMSNKMIADVLLIKEPKALVKADKSEPKSIDEIKSYGVTILPSIGGPGSVLQGITYLQSQKIFITKRSINLIKAFRNYIWLTDKNGNILNEPDHLYSHDPDAVRYAAEDLYKLIERATYKEEPEPPPLFPDIGI